MHLTSNTHHTSEPKSSVFLGGGGNPNGSKTPFQRRTQLLCPADALWKLVAATDPSAAAAASLFGHPHRSGVAAASSPAVPEANSVPATAFQSFLINHLEYFFLLHAISSPTPTP
eukprot:EG_transcript_23939